MSPSLSLSLSLWFPLARFCAFSADAKMPPRRFFEACLLLSAQSKSPSIEMHVEGTRWRRKYLRWAKKGKIRDVLFSRALEFESFFIGYSHRLTSSTFYFQLKFHARMSRGIFLVAALKLNERL